MIDVKYTYWQSGVWLLGYLDDYPEHWTQGKDVPELEEMLLDLYEIFKRDEAKAAVWAASVTGRPAGCRR
ncbi:MAG: type II toxin-antitoxin system HicB family antitoxin [Spirochaetaceae bacterium]|jgi:hypothetical protein|nr:type II toxin-antitoxin system HicB family antitoxin [Spirochaetaceae bacterium]